MRLTYICGLNVSFVRTLFSTAFALLGLALERGQGLVWFGLVFLACIYSVLYTSYFQLDFGLVYIYFSRLRSPLEVWMSHCMNSSRHEQLYPIYTTANRTTTNQTDKPECTAY